MRKVNKNLNSKKKVTVIGGGIIGLATACRLVQDSFDVTLIDENKSNKRASIATAGIIGGSSVIPWANDHLWKKIPSMLLSENGPLKVSYPLPADFLSFIYKSHKSGSNLEINKSSKGLAALGLKGWTEWQSLIKPFVKLKKFFTQNGCLLYYGDKDEYLNEIKNNNLRRRHGMNIKNLTTKELLLKIPKTTDKNPLATLILKAGHLTDPSKFQDSLINELKKNGVKKISASARSFEMKDNKISNIITTKGKIKCDYAIICSGTGGKDLAKKLGSEISMIPAWGTSIIFKEPKIKINQPILIEKKGFAIVPNGNDLRVAGLVQVGGKANIRNLKFENILLNQMKKIFGRFKYKGISYATGARPLTPDSLPVIGPSPNYKNVFFNFGHGHWGMTHAPVCANIVSNLIGNRKNKINIKAYDASRFH
ncbi:NAD(P)/FAD-dependent oxidoreductase [Candidatus Pelagibacter sp. HIMB1623]|uniref:NAD(P)/FAD-dependent oxidoreductase n=1 Tax=Candidatus Pelagibacter sp. HIMB1623 TaxID=3413358 RepID=UPI003F86F168